MYSVRHIVNNYVMFLVTEVTRTYHGDHFEIYRDKEPLCCITGTNRVVGQLYFKNKQTKLIEKEIGIVIIRGGGGGGLDEVGQKVQTTSYKYVLGVPYTT